MKLLFIAAIPINRSRLDGVSKKVLWQAGALQRYGNDVDLLYYGEGKVRLWEMRKDDFTECGTTDLGPGKSKVDVLKAAKKLLPAGTYDGAFVRYPRSDALFLEVLRSLKERGVPVFLEMPTFPYEREGWGSCKGWVINILDRLYRRKIGKYVHRIVTYSVYDEIFGVKTVRTKNGIAFDEIFYDTEPVEVKKQIDLIAVASMYPMHGYDRLMEGMRSYYDAGGARDIRLKLVGTGPEQDRYQALLERYGLESHVMLCGAKFGQELEELYKGAAAGVNSLALHRQGLVRGSSIKSREYIAKGLPILSSTRIDALSQQGHENYVMQIPPDESPVDMEQLIRFVDRIYAVEQQEQAAQRTRDVRETIRNDGRAYGDISVTMKPVMDAFLELSPEGGAF